MPLWSHRTLSHPSVLFIPVIISLSQPAFSNCTKANQLLTSLQVDEVNRADRVRGIVDFTVAPTGQFSLASAGSCLVELRTLTCRTSPNLGNYFWGLLFNVGSYFSFF